MVNYSNALLMLGTEVALSHCKNLRHIGGGSEPHHQKLGHLQDASSGSGSAFDQASESARVRYFMHEQARQREILTAAGYAPAQSGSRYYVDGSDQSYLVRLFYACFLAIAAMFLVSLCLVFAYRKCLLGGDRETTPNKTLIRFQNGNLPPGTKVEKNDDMVLIEQVMRRN